jgi:hypothetical protein
MRTIEVLKLCLPIFSIWIALCLSCALWVTRRRRTGESRGGDGRAAGDPFFYPFGEMPNVPTERHLIAGDFRAWGKPALSPPSACALRRNESGGRICPVSKSLSSGQGPVVVLTFPRRQA